MARHLDNQYEFKVLTLNSAISDLSESLNVWGDQGYQVVGYSNEGPAHKFVMQRKK